MCQQWPFTASSPYILGQNVATCLMGVLLDFQPCHTTLVFSLSPLWALGKDTHNGELLQNLCNIYTPTTPFSHKLGGSLPSNSHNHWCKLHTDSLILTHSKYKLKIKWNHGMGKSKLCQGMLSPFHFLHCEGSRFLRSGRSWAIALGCIIFLCCCHLCDHAQALLSNIHF